MSVWDNENAQSPYWIEEEIVFQDSYGLRHIEFSEGDHVIDIGANIGMFAIRVFQICPKAIVHSFEPCPQNYQHLLMNHMESGVTMWACYPLAIGRSRIACASYDPVNTGSSNIFTATEGDPIKVVPLDGFVAKFDRVRLIKADCEGAEYEIFEDFTLWDRVDFISVEIHPPPVGCTMTPEGLVRHLRSKPVRLKLTFAGFTPAEQHTLKTLK